MKQLKLKGLKIAKFGKESYHMIVSKAFVDDAELLEPNKEYDVTFSEVDENPSEMENHTKAPECRNFEEFLTHNVRFANL
jgi:hypothetical protein